MRPGRLRLKGQDETARVGRAPPASDAEARNADFLRERTAINWGALGYDDRELADLVEFPQRIIQSMVIAPPEHPRDPAQLRAYLRRWVAPAVRLPGRTAGPARQSWPDG